MSRGTILRFYVCCYLLLLINWLAGCDGTGSGNQYELNLPFETEEGNETVFPTLAVTSTAQPATTIQRLMKTPTETQVEVLGQTPVSGLAPEPSLTAMPDVKPVPTLPSYWLVYANSLGGIEVIQPNGTGHRKMIKPSGFQGSPAWSPDGKWLAFLGTSTNWNKDIYFTRADGSELKQLVSTQEDTGGVSWSFDNKTIVYSYAILVEGDFRHNVFVVNLENREVLQLTDAFEVDSFSPAFSPTDHRIAYLSRSNNPDNQYKTSLMRIDIDEGGKVQLLPEDIHVAGFSWSPDGKQIVFSSGKLLDYGRSCDNLFILNLETNQITRLTHHDKNDAVPSWSPDGEWIAFTRTSCDAKGNHHGHVQIFLVHIPTGVVKKVTHFESFNLNGSIGWYPFPSLQQNTTYAITEIGAQVNVRDTAGVDGGKIMQLTEGTQIYTLEGPVEKDYLLWWYIEVVSDGNVNGWIAEAPGWFSEVSQ